MGSRGQEIAAARRVLSDVIASAVTKDALTELALATLATAATAPAEHVRLALQVREGGEHAVRRAIELAAVVRGGTVEEYVYGADDKRVEKRVTSDGVTKVTRYLAADVELREGKLVRYVFIGGQRAVRLDGTDDTVVGHGRAEIAASVVPGRLPGPLTWLAALSALGALALTGLRGRRRWGGLR